MTAPDYSKCPIDPTHKTKLLGEGERYARYKCAEPGCPLVNTTLGSTGIIWRGFHDRLAAVREAATKAERERIAQKVYMESKNSGDILDTLAARIRAGE